MVISREFKFVPVRDRSCARGMIHNIHLISQGCPRPSLAVQCRIIALNTNHFIYFGQCELEQNAARNLSAVVISIEFKFVLVRKFCVWILVE